MSAFDPKRTLTPSHRGPWTVPRACRSKTHYFIVTLASARAAGMFGGGNGPASTSTKVVLAEIGASPANLCWRSSISAGVICLFIFFSSSRFDFGPSVTKETDDPAIIELLNGAVILVVRLRQICRGAHHAEWVEGTGGSGFPDGRFD